MSMMVKGRFGVKGEDMDNVRLFLKRPPREKNRRRPAEAKGTCKAGRPETLAEKRQELAGMKSSAFEGHK